MPPPRAWSRTVSKAPSLRWSPWRQEAARRHRTRLPMVRQSPSVSEALAFCAIASVRHVTLPGGEHP